MLFKNIPVTTFSKILAADTLQSYKTKDNLDKLKWFTQVIPSMLLSVHFSYCTRLDHYLKSDFYQSSSNLNFEHAKEHLYILTRRSYIEYFDYNFKKFHLMIFKFENYD